MFASRGRRAGFSLVELIVAIVVAGIAVAAAARIFSTTLRGSGDPMVRQQAELIAEAYLDEILIKRFYDPDTNTVCTGTVEGSRGQYDNVCDYDGLSEAPHDQFGNAIAALSAYTVQVTVSNAGVSLNGIDNTGVVRILRVDVTVTGPAGTNVVLSSYRTNYECNTAGDAECKSL